MKFFPVLFVVLILVICFSVLIGCAAPGVAETAMKPRVIATTDGEIDDQCSMVRFLLYSNEWDIEGIVTSSSQYHWRGHNWAGDDWIDPYLDAYEKIYPNLIRHDPDYPTPEYLREHTVLGNVDAEGEMDKVTPGSELIVNVLLDETDDRPVWLQAWGGTNTIARALKTIEEDHPEKVEYVAEKIRLFSIWEQDDTYQKYIRPHWEKYNILSIISDQFGAIAYRWDQFIPQPEKSYFEADWMNENILNNHGPLCSLYEAKENGDFRSEGDSPAFMHAIDRGLGNLENPGWGGWGGRYVLVRNNTWLDPIEGFDYTYPEGRYYSSSGYGRQLNNTEGAAKHDYYKPIWRWSIDFQNDWAARADWCVAERYDDANHNPVAVLNGSGGKDVVEMTVKSGETVRLSANGSSDPDGDSLELLWFRYNEADSFHGEIELLENSGIETEFIAPDVDSKQTIHVILKVSDLGEPNLTSYRRAIITVTK